MATRVSGTAPRRRFIQSAAALGLLQVFRGVAPASAQGGPGPAGELRVGGDRDGRRRALSPSNVCRRTDFAAYGDQTPLAKHVVIIPSIFG